jgi:proline iminopeptidase
MMDTGDGHQIYFEQCGNPQGLPVVVLHGGPASGSSPMQRRFFDPGVFRIVLFDQRGCGRSTPRAGLVNNDTNGLLRDIEQLRRQVGIDRWLVFGGSWGASLGLAYAAAHPGACLGLLLRGTFLTGSRDLDWFFGGAASLLPQAWEQLVANLGLDLRLDEADLAGHAVLATLIRQLAADDPAAAAMAAAAWAQWEDAVSRPGFGGPGTPGASAGTATVEPGPIASAAPRRDLVDKYRVQAHYLQQQCFLGEERLLEQAARLGGLPVEIVHGRLDWVCRPANAWATHRAIGGSRLTWVDQGGHNPYEPAMLAALGAALQRFQERLAP